MEELCRWAEEEYGAKPEFTLQIIIISGVLQWNYELQVPVSIRQ